MKYILMACMLFTVMNLIAQDEFKNCVFREDYKALPEKPGKEHYFSGNPKMNSGFSGMEYWGDVEFSFKIRFPKTFPQKYFGLAVKDSGYRNGNVKFGCYNISISQTGISSTPTSLEIDGKPVKPSSDSVPYSGFSWRTGIWYDVKVNMESDRIRFTVEAPGLSPTVLYDREVYPGGGGVRVFTYDTENPFDITDIKVMELKKAPPVKIK